MTINTVKGFTLVEILIVVAIIAIIASIAVPSYQDSVKKTRRTDGKEALLNAAALQEKIYLQKNAYSADVEDLGGGTTKKGYYTISIAQAEGATNTYALTATATGAQASDSKCAKLTLSHTGLQEAFASDGAKSEVCW